MPDPVALWVEFTAPAFLPGGATWDGAIMVTIRGPGISKVDAPFPAYLVYSTFVELPAKVIVRTLQGHPRFALACVLGHWDGIRERMGPGRLESLQAVR